MAGSTLVLVDLNLWLVPGVLELGDLNGDSLLVGGKTVGVLTLADGLLVVEAVDFVDGVLLNTAISAESHLLWRATLRDTAPRVFTKWDAAALSHWTRSDVDSTVLVDHLVLVGQLVLANDASAGAWLTALAESVSLLDALAAGERAKAPFTPWTPSRDDAVAHVAYLGHGGPFDLDGVVELADLQIIVEFLARAAASGVARLSHHFLAHDLTVLTLAWFDDLSGRFAKLSTALLVLVSDDGSRTITARNIAASVLNHGLDLSASDSLTLSGDVSSALVKCLVLDKEGTAVIRRTWSRAGTTLKSDWSSHWAFQVSGDLDDGLFDMTRLARAAHGSAHG